MIGSYYSFFMSEWSIAKKKNNRHLKKISKLNNMKNDVNNFLKYYYEYDEFINLIII